MPATTLLDLRRPLALATALALSPAAGAATSAALPPLRIAADRHAFALADGTPFFWLGDTGWLLFTLSPADLELYLADRARREFNVIQCMVLRVVKGEFTPCHSGERPFASLAPLTFNERYFAHLDRVVAAAARHGLRLAMATMWGSDAVVVFRDPERDNYAYTRFLAERYREQPHVIWIACGEYEKIEPRWKEQGNKFQLTPRQKLLLGRLGEGLHDGSSGRALITVHPVFSSGREFHDAPWLDFNMQQTFGNLRPNVSRIAEDYARKPPRPVLNGEPGYEKRTEDERTSWHLRNEGYWSVFSGAAGFTYGAQGLWQFDENWREALAFEGGSQMCYLRRLIESRPMAGRVPRRGTLVSVVGDAKAQTAIVATGASDGAFLMVYSAAGLPFEVDLARLTGAELRAWWFNPRDGATCTADGKPAIRPFATVPAGGKQRFAPPTSGPRQDWVLVLDDAARGFAAPGRPAGEKGAGTH